MKPDPEPAGHPDRVRAFLAFEVDPAVRARLAALVDELRGSVKDVRWVASPSLHLTLRFLGDSSRDQLERIEARLRPAASACPAFETRIAGLGLFPERGSPRVLWVGIALPATALALQAACEEAAVAVGFPPENRAFRSHLTLGRWRERAPRPTLPEADLGSLRVETLVLYRSELRPTGAVYTALSRLPLGLP